ncbi:hypothetical protein VP01_2623g1, partial [Puccinia sorghi]
QKFSTNWQTACGLRMPSNRWATRSVPCSLLVQMKAFSDDNIVSKAINAFLKFAVRITKQDAKMHVIFTSSDSFFENWLQQRVNPTHFKTLVVGDLPLQEAHNYFLHMVENYEQISKENKDILTSINFDIPFKMTGGRMFFIDQYIDQLGRSGYFEDRTLFLSFRFSHLLQARATCLHGNASQTCWEGQDIKQDTSSHCLAVIEEMIERNFLHFRPVSDFSRDLIPSPLIPVVTAQSEPALRVMEMFVKNYGQQFADSMLSGFYTLNPELATCWRWQQARTTQKPPQGISHHSILQPTADSPPNIHTGQIREADQRLEPTILPRYIPQRPQSRDQDNFSSFRDEVDYRHVSFFLNF